MPGFDEAVIETPRRRPVVEDDSGGRCAASVCQTGRPDLRDRPVWAVTWLEDRRWGERTRLVRAYCSPRCREYGAADTHVRTGEQVPGSYRYVDPPLNEHAVD